MRRGDFTEPDSLRDAFQGATQVLIVSSNTLGVDDVRPHRNAIDAAVAAGAGRILYTSHMGARPDSTFIPARSHFATEQLLRSCGLPFTALRNGFYTATPVMFAGSASETGSFALPADGPVSWTTQGDLAEAAAIALAQEGRLDGLTPPLTAAQALTFDDVAATLTEVAGREVTRSVISDEEFTSALLARGVPRARADFSLGMFAAMRAGDFAAVDPTLERLLGRSPTTLREVLAAGRAAGRPAGEPG